MVTVNEGRRLLDMEMLAEKQIVATVAAAIIVARNATETAAIKSAWDDASRIVFPPIA